MLVVCGSASSWMQDNLVNNHGGLYGRITYEICLRPFTLGECEAYYKSRDIRMSRYDMVQSYMIFGGIPYYLGYLRHEYSLAQNVEDIYSTRRKLKYKGSQIGNYYPAAEKMHEALLSFCIMF